MLIGVKKWIYAQQIVDVVKRELEEQIEMLTKEKESFTIKMDTAVADSVKIAQLLGRLDAYQKTYDLIERLEAAGDEEE